MKKTKQIQIARPTFILHLTVLGVPPASSDEKKKLQIVRPTSMLHLTIWGVPPASADEKTETCYQFHVT